MDVSILIFIFFAGLTILGAVLVAFLNNVVYAGFSLLFTFFGVAGLYVFLSADFIAGTQLMVYVGGILVLILFGVMLTQKVMSTEIISFSHRLAPGAVAAGAFGLLLLILFYHTDWAIIQKPAVATTETIGTLLMTDWVLPFEVASVLLLIALIGAAMFARRERRS